MTIYCYDTEFLDDGRTIELISIGIVCEDGREYYAVNADCQFGRVKEHDWLLRNVVPYLPIEGRASLDTYLEHQHNVFPRPSINLVALDRSSSEVKPKWVIANEVRDFIVGHIKPLGAIEAGPGVSATSVYAAEDLPELWAYFGAYDHVALAQLWGPMANLPHLMPMWTHDLMQLIEPLDGFEKPAAPEDKHNALADARWNMQVLQAAKEFGAQHRRVVR